MTFSSVNGLGSTGSLLHFIYMFIHLYVCFFVRKINSSSS